VKPENLENILRNFKRQMILAGVLRLAIILAISGIIIWTTCLPEPEGKRLLLLTAVGLLLTWILLMLGSARTAREVQAGSVLLGMGQLDDAEVWLRKAVEGFSISVRGKLLAGQQLAALCMKRQAYEEVATICRALLAQRLNRLQSVWINTRIMLADSLLYLDRVTEAYEAMRPVYDVSLSLADRIKLLPVQLRYELSAGHTESAVSSLREKIKMAELLDSAGAALVHALLAEACRQRAMTAQCGFLIERARLYHDLDKLVERYGIIAPIAGQSHPDVHRD